MPGASGVPRAWCAVAANLLNREFTAEAPNQRWVGDTTEFVIGESGKLYLAVMLDLFSRFVVDWAVSAVNDRHLVLEALWVALKRRCPGARLLHQLRRLAPRVQAQGGRQLIDHVSGSYSHKATIQRSPARAADLWVKPDGAEGCHALAAR